MARNLYRLNPRPPPSISECLDSSAFEYLNASVAETMDSLVAQPRLQILREEADRNAHHAAVIIAPSAAAFAAGKLSTKTDISFFRTSTGHVNEFFMRETAKQLDVRLTGAMLP